MPALWQFGNRYFQNGRDERFHVPDPDRFAVLLPERRGATPSVNDGLIGLHQRKLATGIDGALGGYPLRPVTSTGKIAACVVELGVVEPPGLPFDQSVELIG